MAGKKYLLDTHALIWFQEDNPRLSNKANAVFKNAENEILFSQLSLFELAIKQTIGKLVNIQGSLAIIHDAALADGLIYLPVENAHIYRYSEIDLKANHRDPFDRLLIATAIEEKAIIISGDEKFSQYAGIVEVLW